MRLSLALQTDLPLSTYGPLAAQAEGHGFDTLTVYNDLLYQPAWLPLLEIARATTRVRLGPAAVNPFTCHPLNIAGNIALIDEASQGRAYLGLARGAWLEYLGLAPAHPVTALREAFACIRHLLHQNTAPLPGQIFSLAGGDSLRWNILRPDIPFLLGAWGKQTVRACLPFVSEIKIGGTANPALVAQIRQEVDQAAADLGLVPQVISLVVGAVTVVDADGPTARALARRKAALYLPVVAPLDTANPVDPELLTRISTAAANFDFDRAARDISDDLLERFAFVGTPAQVAQQTQALAQAGADRIEFGTPHGLTAQSGLRFLGEAVLPILKSSG